MSAEEYASQVLDHDLEGEDSASKGLTEVLTNDDHFGQEGFRVLFRPAE